MIAKKFYDQAAAAYLCNVDEFISTGEGRALTRLENLRVRTKYPEVELWYDSLDREGRQRVDIQTTFKLRSLLWLSRILRSITL